MPESLKEEGTPIMARTTLEALTRRLVKKFKAAESLSLSEWADKYRWLSTEASAQAGPWRTETTPYLKEVMDACTDERVHWVTFVAASQVGKTEVELNYLAYVIDQDPGSVLYIHPTDKEAEKFSALRIGPMIRDTKRIRYKVSEAKGRDAKNTKLQKSFSGGLLTLIGSNSPAALASMPIRYLICDEIDRWATQAGGEGDPFMLARARQTTFYNWKTLEVSTPTVKDQSKIAQHFQEGTQERYETRCPHCGKFHEITFDDLDFRGKYHKHWIDGKKTYTVDPDIFYSCPNCGALSTEQEMKESPSKWVARNPDAASTGHRSFWLNAFLSPWVHWDEIVRRFLNAKDNPKELQVVKNTLFGELWENKGAYDLDETGLFERKESYGLNDDGTFVEVPDQVAYLTMAVDTQDDRFEYEILGHGVGGETWGIKKGMIVGRPDSETTQSRLREIILEPHYFKNHEHSLRPALTFIDSGGHFTQTVYQFCKEMFHYRVFPIKGKGGENVNFTSPPNKVPIGENKRNLVRLYTIGVDDGKALIMNNLQVPEPGPLYCHFPLDPEAGYDRAYFLGLVSERMELVENKTTHKESWRWVKIEGRKRNEPLDLRNYNLAAARILNLNPQTEIEKRQNEKKPATKRPATGRKKTIKAKF